MRPRELLTSRDYRLAVVVARHYGCRVGSLGESDIIVDTLGVRKPDGSPVRQRIVGLLEGGLGVGVLRYYNGPQDEDRVKAWLKERGFKVLSD